MDQAAIRRIVEVARSDGREQLLEPEGLEVLRAIGVGVPEHRRVADADQARELDLSVFPGDHVVVKTLSPQLIHKSEVGGIAFVEKRGEAIAAAIRDMAERLGETEPRGFLIAEHVPHDQAMGSELLLSARWTEDFGPIVTFGLGGVYAEYLATNAGPEFEPMIGSAQPVDAEQAERQLGATGVARILAGELRGQPRRVEIAALLDVYLKFAELAAALMPDQLSELEVNPLVISQRGPIALDVLARCPKSKREHVAPRPLHKLRNLLQPKTLALIGVSERMNPGRVILGNLIQGGFDRRRIFIVKTGATTIEDCACYPDIMSLPGPVDLLVVSVAAPQLPDLLTTVVNERKAESLIVIPGGLEERAASRQIVQQLRATLARARTSEWGGPLINGGNSLGVRSEPGGYDTTFIPAYKQGQSVSSGPRLALVSQSGAFAVARASKLTGIRLRYSISVGNQMDLTVGDYLTYLKDDPEIDLFAVYLEGFRPLDGLRFLEAIREITAQGKEVVLYRAGRTGAGASASASHTAAIASDYAVTRSLASAAGAVVCETLAEFEDLVKLFALFRKIPLKGGQLGALSNAGFECVTIADHLGTLQLADFAPQTARALRDILRSQGLDEVVDVRNPLDLTPISDDAAYEAAVRTVMEDEGVAIGLVGCVPLTPALATLPASREHEEDLYGATSVASRLLRLKKEIAKPWVAVIDAGPLYDPLVDRLEEHGIPTFRTADRALLRLNRFCARRLARS